MGMSSQLNSKWLEAGSNHTPKSWAISQMSHWKGACESEAQSTSGNNEFHREQQFWAWNDGITSHHQWQPKNLMR